MTPFRGSDWTYTGPEQVFDPAVLRVLRYLDDKYGLWVSIRGTEAAPRCEILCLNAQLWDDYPMLKLHSYGLPRSPDRVQAYNANDAIRIFRGQVDGCPYESLATRLAAMLHYWRAYDLFETIISPVVEDNTIRTQVLYPPRKGRYNECPVLMDPIRVDPMALVRGVVLPINGTRYKVTFDWTTVTGEEGGYLETYWKPGDRPVTFEPTDEPLTENDPDFNGGWNVQMKLGGVGRSQQDDCAPDYQGRKPYCLAVWENGNDFTFTLMLSLDEDGRPAVCWLEGSGT